MPDGGPFQGGSYWLDSLLYDDVLGAFGTWPDTAQLMPWARLPLTGWAYSTSDVGIAQVESTHSWWFGAAIAG
jgi:hypothetical protein